MENKKMSCWDFVFSSVKTHIDDLVRQADKYTKDMNEDFEHFFCWYAEDMYKTQRELSCYRALIELDRNDGSGQVIFKGETVKTYEHVMVADINQIQAFASALR